MITEIVIGGLILWALFKVPKLLASLVVWGLIALACVAGYIWYFQNFLD